MLTKIAGRTRGIARRSTIFLTRIDALTYINENWLDGLQMVYDHIIANDYQGKAVVNMSIKFKSMNQGWINRFGMFIDARDTVLQSTDTTY